MACWIVEHIADNFISLNQFQLFSFCFCVFFSQIWASIAEKQRNKSVGVLEFAPFSYFHETKCFILVVSDSAVNVEEYFSKLLKDDDKSAGIAAIETLLMVLEKTNCKSSDKNKKKIKSNQSVNFIISIAHYS